MSTYYISPQTTSSGTSSITTTIPVTAAGLNGTSGYSWTQDYSISGALSTSSGTVNINTNGIEMQPGTDITIGGKSLMDAIDRIEERLGILHPNPELEDRWDQLKDLRRQYQELEKELLEKEKMWKILKKA